MSKLHPTSKGLRNRRVDSIKKLWAWLMSSLAFCRSLPSLRSVRASARKRHNLPSNSRSCAAAKLLPFMEACWRRYTGVIEPALVVPTTLPWLWEAAIAGWHLRSDLIQCQFVDSFNTADSSSYPRLIALNSAGNGPPASASRIHSAALSLTMRRGP